MFNLNDMIADYKSGFLLNIQMFIVFLFQNVYQNQ